MKNLNKYLAKTLYLVLMLSIIAFSLLTLFNVVVGIVFLVKFGDLSMVIWNVILSFIIIFDYLALLEIKKGM